MTVVLWGIDANKRRKNNSLNTVSAQDWTLEEYYDVARRCIGAFAVGSLARSMLRNEDAISFVAEHLMYAAFRWDASKGRTLTSYLNQCAIWSIHRWLVLSNKSTQQSMSSLNVNVCDNSNTQLYELIEDTTVQPPDDIVSEQEYLAYVLDDAGLTQRQRHCVEVVYIQGQRPSDVARDLGISRQAVDQCLKKSIHKIRVVIDDQKSLSV